MQTCASCGTDNPAGHRFCGGCGSSLASGCPSCGAPAVAGFAFCGACGSPMATSSPVAAAPVTERRVCSVLFADLVGFTPLAESRDPEEVRALLSRYFDIARTVIDRYGGVVEKFIGDAVVAVWGTPVATEGDAERAVRAGLDLVAQVTELGLEIGAAGLTLRAGVVTGEVAATLGAVGEGMVAGDAVNTAARVQSVADPGAVWVDGSTQRLAALAIGFGEAGDHVLKGKAEPMRLWRATRVLGVVGGAQRLDGLEAPMVGRGPEERTLRELFHASLDRRSPRLVVVSGAAGVGKSRLGWEFETYVDGLAVDVKWHRGRCLSYGDGVAYWALAEAVRQRFGIAEEDPVDVATATFLRRLPEFVVDEAERTFVGVRLGRLLGLEHPADTGAELPRDEMFAGWRLFLERLTDSAPVVLLVEDGQHADEGLLDFLDHLVDWARQSPLYLVLFTRSELLDARPSLGVGRNRAQLSLDPLDEQSMRQMVDALVRDLPDDAVGAIVDQAEGNPLFAVETVRSLVDRDVIMAVDGEYRCVGDVGELTVPDSLHGLLAARLDTLDPSLRALVADAAVVGTTFPPEALVAVSGRPAAEVTTALVELVRRGVLQISTDTLSPQRGAYGFAQNLLRQVAYDTLSRADRRRRHLAVAEHLQRVFADGGEEVMDVVARHYLDALDATAKGEHDRERIAELAVASLLRAAERAERSGAPARASQQYARAAGLRGDTADAAALWERSGASAILSGRDDAVTRAGAEAGRICAASGDRDGAARAQVLIAWGLYRQRRHTEALAVLEPALPDLLASAEQAAVEALLLKASIHAFSGDATGSIEAADQALALAQTLDLPLVLQADLLSTAGTGRLFAQRTLEASAFLWHALRVAEAADDARQACRAALNLSGACLTEDPREAVVLGRRAVRDAQRVADTLFLGTAIWNVVFAHLLCGEWDEAVAYLGERDIEGLEGEVDVCARMVMALRGEPLAEEPAGLAGQRTGEDAQDRTMAVGHDALLAGLGGDHEDVVRLGRDLLASTADFPEMVVLIWPFVIRSALTVGDLAEVRRQVDLVAGEPIAGVPLQLRADAALAAAALASYGGDAGVDDLFADALRLLRAAPGPHHLAHGLLEHADHLERSGRDGSALRAEAGAIAERLGAVDLRERLARVPLGRGVAAVTG